jgi:hypothetical protein
MVSWVDQRNTSRSCATWQARFFDGRRCLLQVSSLPSRTTWPLPVCLSGLQGRRLVRLTEQRTVCGFRFVASECYFSVDALCAHGVSPHLAKVALPRRTSSRTSRDVSVSKVDCNW